MPILQRLIDAYKLWHNCRVHLDKLTKFGLGLKIESLFLETIQNIFIASRKPRDKRLVYLTRASDALDVLKFMLQIMWEMNKLDNGKYISLSNPLDEIGRMLGGWLKQTTSPFLQKGRG